MNRSTSGRPNGRTIQCDGRCPTHGVEFPELPCGLLPLLDAAKYNPIVTSLAFNSLDPDFFPFVCTVNQFTMA